MLLLVILLFKTAPGHSTEMLPSVPQGEKAGMCLPAKIHGLDKLRSGTSCAAALAVSSMAMNR